MARDRRQLMLLLVVVPASLIIASLIVGFLQDVAGVPNPSSVYLVAVVLCALTTGTIGAIVASVGSFLIYDFLFVDPRYTFTITDPGEYISLILLLFAGIVVGQLVAIQRSRTEIARSRERQARALFRLSRTLATRESTLRALPEIVDILLAETHMQRVWISMGDDATERAVADSTTDSVRPHVASYYVLRRMPGEQPAEWVRIHTPSAAQSGRVRAEANIDLYRVRIETPDQRFGSVWAVRLRHTPAPDRFEIRLMATIADQLGQVFAHDRLAAEAQAAEIARQSDELKSALLQSVSHDLRTPLATIRAAAGSLRPSSGLLPVERDESVDAIDREVDYLNRLVTNLLDLSRIEAGALHAERDVFELDDLIGRSLERLRLRLGTRQVSVSLDVPPVDVDPIFLDSAFTNIVDNAIKYTPPDAPVSITARRLEGGLVRLTVEDGGPGVPADAIGRLFEKFYRVPGSQHTSRSGTGIGLAVVRGLVEAMGGQVHARRSDLGGLAIDIDLEAAEPAPAAVDNTQTVEATR